MRLFSVLVLVGDWEDFESGRFWSTHRCGDHYEEGNHYYPDPRCCTCPSPKNWFFPHEIRFTRDCQKYGVKGLAPEGRPRESLD